MATQSMLLFGRQIKVSRTAPGPIERVWAYLTSSELLEKWLAVGDDIGLRGSRVHLVQTADIFPWKKEGYLCGVVVERDDPYHLAYTFKHIVGDVPEEEVEESLVEFDLRQEGSLVRLEITHSRLGREELPWVYAEWTSHLEFLIDALILEDTERPQMVAGVKPDFFAIL